MLHRVTLSRLCVLWAVALTVITVATPSAEPGLTIAAASDLQSALPSIARQFERDSSRQVTVTFGSSGNFFTQIQNGAPFDLFLSADIDYPQRLESSGVAERGSLVRYARGRIVLWTRRDSGIDLASGLSVLNDARVRRIAIANPEHAPYGRAAVAAMRAEHVYDAVRSKLVIGENISQAAQFAQSGSADVGIVALSLALTPALKNAGSYVDVPDHLYPAIQQAAVIVAASREKPLARQFVERLISPAVMERLRQFGFAPPQPAAR